MLQLQHTKSQYQIRGNSQSGHAISISRTVTCTPPEKTVYQPTLMDITVYVPRNEPEYSKTYKCTKRIQTVCTYTGFVGSKSILDDKLMIKHISPIECKNAFTMKQYENQVIRSIQSGLWSTDNTLNVEYKWCCKNHMSRNHEFLH